MVIVQHLASFVLRPLLEGFLKVQGISAGVQAVDAVSRHFDDYFRDHSQRLSQALRTASCRAWQALEVALRGESLWSRLSSRAEDRAFREQVRVFLDAAPLRDLPDGPAFRERCTDEIRQARRLGLLDGSPDVRQLAGQLGTMARFGDTQALLDEERRQAMGIGEVLRKAGFKSLADLISMPEGGTPLLLLSLRYFFRREVSGDEVLFRELMLGQMDSLSKNQVKGFEALFEALSLHGDELHSALEELRGTAEATHSAVLDIREEMRGMEGMEGRLAERQLAMYRQVLRLLERLDLKDRPLRPDDSFSIRGEGEIRHVKQLLAEFQEETSVPVYGRPALSNGMGKLLTAAGMFGEAIPLFDEAAEAVGDPAAGFEARLNGYHAALECRDWAKAMAELGEMVRLTGQRGVPVPLDRYEPEEILGAGGFGVVFRCRHRHSGAVVAVKALRVEGLGRDAGTVMREASVLERLRHDSIIRLRDCGYVEGDPGRPYLALDYFEGLTLEEFVKRNGPLPAQECADVARQVAAGLMAAHAEGVLHRDVKPGNVLLHRHAGLWRVKVIDFGLALRQKVLRDTIGNVHAVGNTVLGISVAGTIDYAAPEQLGKLAGVQIGTYSDIYSFGKLCCFALFGTTNPGPRHWNGLASESLRDLIGDCLSDLPGDRPASFDIVLNRLGNTNVPIKLAGEGTIARGADPVRASEARTVTLDVRPEERTLVDTSPTPPPPLPVVGATAGVNVTEQARPFRLRSGEEARSLEDFFSLCESRPEGSAWHLMESHFEPWLGLMGQSGLAKLAKNARESGKPPTEALLDFLVACESAGALPVGKRTDTTKGSGNTPSTPTVSRATSVSPHSQSSGARPGQVSRPTRGATKSTVGQFSAANGENVKPPKTNESEDAKVGMVACVIGVIALFIWGRHLPGETAKLIFFALVYGFFEAARKIRLGK